MENKLLLGIVAVALSATACQEAQVKRAAQEYPVMTAQLSDETVSDSYSASIRGRQDVSVMPQVAGTLTELRVGEGDRVRRGQVLFVIDQVPYRAALETAKANVEAARAQVAQAELAYESRKALREKNVVSDYDLQTAHNTLLTSKAALAQAEANLVNASNSLSYTEVKSPADGVVGTLPYRVGALVGPSMPTPLTTVSDNSQMYVYFSMNESQVLQLLRRYGSTSAALEKMPDVALRLADDSLYAHTGRIETISGVVDRSTGSAQLRAIFPNPEGLLLSGTSGNVVLARDLKGVIVIPQTATVEVQNKTFVYGIVDGLATARQVGVMRLPDGAHYVVTSGLQVGDVIVSEGAGLLRAGTPIVPKGQGAAQANQE